MAVNRYYSNTAVETTLSSDIGSGATSITVGSVSGFPSSYPYTLEIDPDGTMELVTVTSGASTTLTVTRGSDNTSAAAHLAGVTVRHAASAQDLREPQEHMAASTNVHGLSGGAAVVGTTQSQTLTNKTLTAPTIGDFTNATHTHAGASTGGTVAHSALTGLTTGDPHTQYQLESEKGAASGYASLDGSALLPTSQLPTIPTGNLPSIPYANLPVGTSAGSTVADGGHTHTVDAPTYDLTLAQFTLTDGDPGPKTMAEVDLGVGTWLILGTCAGCTLNSGGTPTRWQFDLQSSGGTATFIGAAPVAQGSDGTGVQGGGTVWGLLTVTVATVNVAFTVEKLGSGAQATNSTLGALMALPFHGI